MAINTWTNGAADNDGSNAANWSLGAFDPTDTLTWDATNTDACTFSAAVDCTAIDVQVGYTGNWNDGGQAITVSGAVSINSGGAITCTGTLAQDADGNFSLNCTGTLTVTDWEIDLQGTGNLDLDKSGTKIGKITCAAAGKTTTVTGASGGIAGSYHTVLGAGTFAVNAVYYIIGNTRPSIFEGNASGTINGISLIYLICENNTDKTYSFTPGPTWQNAGCLFRKFSGNGNVIINQVCDWNLTGAMYCYNQTAGTSFTWNCGDYDLIAGTYVRWGSSNATASMTVNLGAGTVEATANDIDMSVYNTGATTINANSATINVGRHYTLGTNTTWNAGTSTITFDGATAGTLTSAGETLGNVVINKAANGVTLQDDLTCGNLTLTSGDFDCNGNDLSCADFLDNNAAGTKTMDGTTTVSGTGTYNQDITFNRLVLTGSTTQTVAAAATVTLTTYTATDMDGSTWASGTPGTHALLTVPVAGITVSHCTFTDIDASGGGVIDATNGTNTDGGNNINILFPTGTIAKRLSRSAIAVGIGVGL